MCVMKVFVFVAIFESTSKRLREIHFFRKDERINDTNTCILND